MGCDFNLFGSSLSTVLMNSESLEMLSFEICVEIHLQDRVIWYHQVPVYDLISVWSEYWTSTRLPKDRATIIMFHVRSKLTT